MNNRAVRWYFIGGTLLGATLGFILTVTLVVNLGMVLAPLVPLTFGLAIYGFYLKLLPSADLEKSAKLVTFGNALIVGGGLSVVLARVDHFNLLWSLILLGCYFVAYLLTNGYATEQVAGKK